MPRTRIESVHMFWIAIRLVRRMRKRYSYGSDVMHTLRPIRRLLLILIQRSATHYIWHPNNSNLDIPRTNLKPNGVIRGVRQNFLTC